MLQSLVDTLAFSHVRPQDVASVPHETSAKFVRLAQLAIEALLNDQASLHAQLDDVEGALEAQQE